MKGNEMTNTLEYWKTRREAEAARVAALTDEQKRANAASHIIGVVDDCYRCINCEIGSWNAWKSHC
jgi:hypothetical protein